ncbi:type II secretion system minor pseudopilin GspK [Perlucidibaca aquatica]|uniref:type II secretion system minor pseudopilin GspK n=1 Tax=Perlucidibaca aquatica TaxID=1852776 RepID=UPI00083A9A1F|nr:type II secretion system minor pseudopilin GspK [Perlucidibaca aquatica]
MTPFKLTPKHVQARSSQRGVALITMMLIAALATTLVLAMIGRQSRLQAEIGAQFQQDQIAEYDRGAEYFAMAALKADSDDGNKTDHPNEYWAQPFPAFPVPGGVIAPTVRDAQARFNLNSLIKNNQVDPVSLRFFKQLLEQLAIPVELTDSLVDWLDEDSLPTGSSGAEDDFYLRQNPAYRCANRSLSTFSELRLVKGFSSDLLRQLAPYVTVLPSSARSLNVNFLSPGLLEAMVPGLSPNNALELLQRRPADGWESVEQFLDNPVFASATPEVRAGLQQLLSVDSQYFELYTRIRFGKRERLQWSLLSRKDGQLKMIASERNPLWVPDNEAAAMGNTESDKEE